MLAREHDPSFHYFAQGAAGRPNVNRVAVLVRAEHDLRRPVVPCHDVLGQILAPLQAQIPAEPEIANLQITVLVEQDVAGFQVPVDYIRRVEELEGAKYLIDEILDVLGEQLLPGADDATQISLHELTDEVDVAEDFALLGNVHNVEEAQNVFVHAVLHDDDLAKDSFCIDLVTVMIY